MTLFSQILTDELNTGLVASFWQLHMHIAVIDTNFTLSLMLGSDHMILTLLKQTAVGIP